ncbi:cobyrinic acid a,c-diamide synthase [Methanomethylovorans hollandica DSM 15978]|uniref:Cobyrinate a,c-diamide synthase n=1 Tax=Methanomethylovorans hollandica (strain DSM 15978 / NBRC 107637 / DMS1) TaxID=867904 RepID=L0KUM8_METHD|nr:Ni-sirohydrochlorin a,c-diamide synthase [Methanomethylovorans hollandica]AGB48806.1 cobyrinic acid a,c-diamide synthase [Methanomethylovorans hollandica DSM 15978]
MNTSTHIKPAASGEGKHIPRVLISAGSSSSGKTTVTIGLLAALSKAGYKVQPFKVGLDYIDPSYYSDITGRRARNIDGYLMDEERVLDVFLHGYEVDGEADIAIIEGVRGLYEGLESYSDIGSTAQIAKILNCAVILVLNARSITRSAAAIVSGFKAFDPQVNIAGVILNNIGGQRHAMKAKEAIEHYTGVPVIGIIHRNNEMMISMRHLGLVPAIEERRRSADFDTRINTIRDVIIEGVDIDKVLDIARQTAPLSRPSDTIFVRREISQKPVIGIALDEAFNFYYHDNLELLQLAGAKLQYFSPVHDKHLPDVDGIYIGGGYPELFAAELEANISMREDMKAASEAGMPIYGECGGLMYLTEKLTTGVKDKGTYHMAEMPESTYDMVGALPGHTLMGHKRVVSYNIGSLTLDTVIGKIGNDFRAHEFHHSEVTELPEDAKFAIKLSRGTGIIEGWDGLTVKNTLGCYAHLVASSYEEFARSFVEFIYNT